MAENWRKKFQYGIAKGESRCLNCVYLCTVTNGNGDIRHGCVINISVEKNTPLEDAGTIKLKMVCNRWQGVR